MTEPFRLGVLLEDLGATQMAFEFVRSANRACSEDPALDVVAFYERLARPVVQPLFARMQANEACGFAGAVVATSLSTAARLRSCLAAASRWFYCYDLEWLRLPAKAWAPLREAYAAPGVRLLARSDSHARALESAWGVPVAAVLGQLDVNQLREIVGGPQV